ncbi:MAG: tetratricopeptide repeat protein [Thiohalorhabdus sp.]|uniref:tetratricopeptide repeat protein n=1 Tax=Thiohalorhabdus sp. TaxID=3094134 RepID=UPI00397F6827
MPETVLDVDSQDFQSRVVERSREVPVVVDFWAAWCGPCQALGPALERVAEEYGGRFLLAKVDVDRNQELAGQHGVRGIPAVKAFVDGEVVDEFTGALPEPQIRRFIDGLIPSETDKAVAQARALLDQGETGRAEEVLTEVLEAEPDHPRALLTQARLRLLQNRTEEAEAILGHLPVAYASDPEVKGLRTTLGFARIAGETGSEAEVREALERDPDDLDARYRLAAYRVMAEDYRSAFEHLLEIVRRDRKYREDAARHRMLELFDLLGNRDPRVSEFRKRLSRELF